MKREDFSFHPERLRRAVTAEESRLLDRHAMTAGGMQGAELMEIAGKGAAAIILGSEDLNPPMRSSRARVLAICGRGNNGGDAIVTAHHLGLSGAWTPELLLTTTETEMSGDAGHHLRAFQEQFPEAVVRIGWDGGERGLQDVLQGFDVVLDGLLGTGFRGEVRDPMASLIRCVNASGEDGPAVIAMDVPSGLDATTGRTTGTSPAIRASSTITFGCWKTGLLLADGPLLAGRIHQVRLPFDERILPSKTFLASLDDRSEDGPVPRLRRRAGHRHKYDGGVVHVIGGSPGLSGAPIMGSKAAWRKGASAVILHGAAGLLARFEGVHPEIISSPVGSLDDLHLEPAHASQVCDGLQSRPGAILLGPGLGRRSAGGGFIEALLDAFRASSSTDAERQRPTTTTPFPWVLDADAMRGITSETLGSMPASGPMVLTPHPGELAALLGLENGALMDDDQRLEGARDLARRTGCHVCSKGSPTIACAPDGTTVITAYDTSPFHRAGFGDVLAGQIASNLSFGADPLHAMLDALLHGCEKATQWTSEHPFSPENAC